MQTASPPTGTSQCPHAGRRAWSALVVGLLVASGSFGCGPGAQRTSRPESAARRSKANPGADLPPKLASQGERPARDEVTSLRVGMLASDDPDDDGWRSEAFSAASEKQLKQLARLLGQPGGITVDSLSPLVDPQVTADPLRPASLSLVVERGPLRVYRGDQRAGSAVEVTVGNQALAVALSTLAERCGTASSGHAAFKTVAVELSDEGATTTVRYAACGQRDGRRVQQQATWHCGWTPETEEAPPRLRTIQLVAFQELELDCGTEPLLRDVTDRVLAHCPAWPAQFRRGQDYWVARIPRGVGMVESNASGLALGDVNGDGLDDLYLAQPGGLPNRLLIHQPDGTLRDVAAESGTDFLDMTTGALFVDVDRDQDQDLLVLLASTLVGFENDGQGKFTLRGTIVELEQAFSLAAADYDRDGQLDVYVTQYAGGGNVGVVARTRNPLPFHDANNGLPNKLLRNQGDWQFRDVTAEVGLDANNRRWSFACAWEDYDRDGDPDLYVANDFGRNNLYRNDQGTFHDVAGEAGVEDIAASMSVTWGDYNRDGWMDLYVGNMWSSAGHRVTFQPEFQTGLAELTRSQFQRHARGNSLFHNRGDGRFDDLSETLQVTLGRWAWSSQFVDLNGDGWEDLYVANGMVTNSDPHDL